jgi:hypothetical protein
MEQRIVWMKEKRVPTTSSSNRRSSQNHVTNRRFQRLLKHVFGDYFIEDADEEIGE